MAAVPPLMLVDEITDFLATNPTPEEILAFQPSESLANRALELLQRNRENRLTPDEHTEMDTFIRMDHFMTLLKAKTRLRLMEHK